MNMKEKKDHYLILISVVGVNTITMSIVWVLLAFFYEFSMPFSNCMEGVIWGSMIGLYIKYIPDIFNFSKNSD